MKAVLEFDLNEPDDVTAHKRCVKSLDMALVLWELVYNTRRELESAPETTDYIELIYEKISDLCDEHHICIDELIN